MAVDFAALDVITAVLQTISIARHLTTSSKELCDGKLTTNQLEEHIPRLTSAINRLHSLLPNSEETELFSQDEKLKDVARDCEIAARELEQSLGLVMDMQGKGNLFKTANFMLQGSGFSEDIQRLEIALAKHQQTMETEIIPHLCPSGDAVEIQSRHNFDDLAENVQHLVVQIAQGHGRLQDLISTDHVFPSKVIDQEGERAQESATKARTLDLNARIQERRDGFLQTLKSPEMNQRYKDLKRSSEFRFQQLFKSYEASARKENEIEAKGTQKARKADGGDPEARQTWAPFIKWLQSSDSLFCIQGLPGSGKSTLMKFLIGNKATRDLLCRWNSDFTILSHFFWRIGSEPQNSMKGFLTSLISQNLEGNERLTDDLLNNHQAFASKSSYDDWSTDELEPLLRSVLQEGRPRCIFIDALDEIRDHHGHLDLIPLIDKLTKFPNFKICVATRPETQIATWLQEKNIPGLLMQDLTRPVMRAFVQGEFQSFLSRKSIADTTYEKLTETLVHQSEGMWLWLHLTTRTLKSGLENGDSDEMLLANLEKLSSVQTPLYTHLRESLGEGNAMNRNSTSRYFHYALQAQGYLLPIFPEVGFPSGYPEVPQPVIFQIVCAENTKLQEKLLAGKDTVDFKEIQRLCEETKHTLETSCAGLLQVQSRASGRLINIIGQANDLDLPKGTKDIERALFSPVMFVHSSAQSFLTDTEEGQKILDCDLSQNEIRLRLMKGLLCLLRVLHSEYGVLGRCSGMFHMIMEISKSEKLGLQKAFEMLPIMHEFYEAGVIGADRPPWRPQAPFLSHFTENAQFDDFIISAVADAEPNIMATDVLREVCDPGGSLYYNSRRVPSANLVKALMSKGADPHVYGVNRRQDMGTMEPFARQGTAFTNLLMFGINSIDEGRYLHGDSACEILKAAVSMAMSCPDLVTTTLVICRLKETGETTLTNVTWLGSPVMGIGADFAWLLCEVDLKFLLLNLLCGLAVDTTERILDGPGISELLPRLKDPSVKLRSIISKEGSSEAFECHRISSQVPAGEITNKFFQLLRTKPETLQQAELLYKDVMHLIKDPSTDPIALESEVLALAKDKLGFCTLLEARVIPSASYIESWEKWRPDHYPVTMKQLKDAVVRLYE